MRTVPQRLAALLVTALLVVGACGGPTSTTAPTQGATTVPATQGPTAAPAQTFHIPEFDAAALRWFCCLGGGEDPDAQVPVEKKVASEFATKYPGSSLKFEVTTYLEAPQVLSTQIAGGTSPDIAGPVGVGGISQFNGQWLDLTPYLQDSAYDLAQFPQNLVDFNKTSDGQIGVPFSLYPTVLWYVPEMFEEIGLEEPPHKYGEKYTLDGQEVDWDYDTVREIAMRLTVDNKGRDAKDPNFDPKHIVQYGFEPQRDDLRGFGAAFGPGNLDSGDGKTAAIPDAWKAAWKWVYDGVWKDHFIMTETVFNSDAIASGDQAFISGKVAMSTNFLWITYGLGSDYGFTEGKWDIAAVPAYNGKQTSPLNADTFAIFKPGKHPDAAFAAMAYLMEDRGDELLQLYGGMPAREAERPAFLEALGKTAGFPADADWQVASDSVQYADVPNFEGAMPKYNETNTILGKYRSRWFSSGGLDIDAQIAQLLAEIQAEWDK